MTRWLLTHLCPVYLSYKPYFFSQRSMFFSHDKLVNSTCSHNFLTKRTGRTQATIHMTSTQVCHSLGPFTHCRSRSRQSKQCSNSTFIYPSTEAAIYLATHNTRRYIIIIVGKIFEFSFLIKLFRDTNVAHIFYKSSQICDTHTNDDSYLGMEGVYEYNTQWKTYKTCVGGK
jgi:hypothetical protein